MNQDATTESPSFESALERLQNIVRKLETGELNLESALKAFEEGVQLVRSCQEQLTTAERKVELLTQISAGKPETQPFTPGRP